MTNPTLTKQMLLASLEAMVADNNRTTKVIYQNKINNTFHDIGTTTVPIFSKKKIAEMENRIIELKEEINTVAL